MFQATARLPIPNQVDQHITIDCKHLVFEILYAARPMRVDKIILEVFQTR
jgi:hypothetical protein